MPLNDLGAGVAMVKDPMPETHHPALLRERVQYPFLGPLARFDFQQHVRDRLIRPAVKRAF